MADFESEYEFEKTVEASLWSGALDRTVTYRFHIGRNLSVLNQFVCVVDELDDDGFWSRRDYLYTGSTADDALAIAQHAVRVAIGDAI